MKNEKVINNKSIDIVGIGNAIVDVLVKVDDTFLIENKLNKGAMTLINEKQAQDLYSYSRNGLQTSGGSAANTITGISQLGGKAAFIGRVKNDELGKIFTNDIQKVGAIFNTPPAQNGPSTARCIIFVSPDAERTMCTYLGASILLDPNSIDSSLIKESKVLYLEGYLWDDDLAKKAFLNASKISKENQGEVSLSLSDSFCVNRHRESFKELIENYIDILFANEEEILSLYETNDLTQALHQQLGKCKIAVITLGEKGSIILENYNQIKIQPYKLGETVDTTGAGDLFAGGFLYGYTKGHSTINCGKIASLCAAHVVTHLGPRAKISLPQLVDLIL